MPIFIVERMNDFVCQCNCYTVLTGMWAYQVQKKSGIKISIVFFNSIINLVWSLISLCLVFVIIDKDKEIRQYQTWLKSFSTEQHLLLLIRILGNLRALCQFPLLLHRCERDITRKHWSRSSRDSAQSCWWRHWSFFSGMIQFLLKYLWYWHTGRPSEV